ncbi:hypothetical protein ACFLUJ_08490, partial [Chloroflexota bacterium]
VQAEDGNPVDLELGGEGAISWGIGDIRPGDNGTKLVELHNVGSRSGFVSIWVSDIISSEGVNPESETGDVTGSGELDDQLLFGISGNRSSTALNLPATINELPQSFSDPNSIEIVPLRVGDIIDLQWEWNLPIQSNNDAQGDGISFTINYLLTEFEIIDVSDFVEEVTGVFTDNVTVESETGNGDILIEEDNIGQTEEGESISEIWLIEIDKEPSMSSDNVATVGAHYDAGPHGTTFDQPITITLNYDPIDLPAGASEANMVIVTWDEGAGEWVELEGSTVDTLNNTISAPTTDLSRYTIQVYIPPPPSSAPAPPIFSVSNLTVQPVEVQPEEVVTITVLVANQGGTMGSYTVVLEIDGQKETEKIVTVTASSSKLVTFSVSREEPGSYSVVVDGLSGSFTVTRSLLEVDLLGKTGTVDIEADGTVGESLKFTDTGGNFIIDINRGTRITGTGDIALDRMELVIAEEPRGVLDNTVALSPIYKVTGYIQGVKVSRINFDPSAEIIILYDPKDLPENAFPPFIATYNEGQGWVRLEPPSGSIFEVGKAKALIHHASLFTVVAEMAPPPPPLPAAFEVSNLTINPKRAQLNQPVIISLTVANEGAVTGSHEFYLIVDGIVRAMEEITLDGNSIGTIKFEVSNLGAGKHQVEIAGSSGEFQIIGASAALPVEEAVDWLFIDLIVAVVIAAGLLVLYLFIRRSKRVPLPSD